jgi:hypothetical protein
MREVIKDSVGKVHEIDIEGTEKRQKEVGDSVVVSKCNRDIVTSIDESEEYTGENFSSIPDVCPACRYQAAT